MIFVRADANAQIATGHIMRCLSIANALKEQGEEVTFVTADEYGNSFLADSGFAHICLQSKWDDLEQEIDFLVSLIMEKKVKLLVLDTYYVTPHYMEALHKVTKVAYIDDLHAFMYPCDILINYSIYANTLPYEQEYPDTKLLLGCQYAPLRKQFIGLRAPQIKKQIQNILILTGGTDPENLTGNLVEHILSKVYLKGIRTEVICGKFYHYQKDLEQVAKDNQGVAVLNHVENIQEHMQRADIVVSAGGSTLYELCACGIPTISYALAENQIKNVKTFQELDLIPYAGDIREGMESLCEEICRLLNEYQCDFKRRQEQSIGMQEAVDGKGSLRIAREITFGWKK